MPRVTNVLAFGNIFIFGDKDTPRCVIYVSVVRMELDVTIFIPVNVFKLL